MTGAQSLEHQTYMMNEVAALVGDGVLDPEAYEQTVSTLLAAISEDNPAITEEPEGAWTHDITDEALQ